MLQIQFSLFSSSDCFAEGTVAPRMLAMLAVACEEQLVVSNRLEPRFPANDLSVVRPIDETHAPNPSCTSVPALTPSCPSGGQRMETMCLPQSQCEAFCTLAFPVHVHIRPHTIGPCLWPLTDECGCASYCIVHHSTRRDAPRMAMHDLRCQHELTCPVQTMER